MCKGHLGLDEVDGREHDVRGEEWSSCVHVHPGRFVPLPGFLFLCRRCSESDDSVYLHLGIQHSNSLCVISCLFFRIF